jgi:hypothetical protein
MCLFESFSLSLMERSRYQEDVEEPHEGEGHVAEKAELVVEMEIRFQERIHIAKDA